jgi:hypothetical protein
VVLAGMRLPPNYGPYASDFQRSFVDIAKAKKAPLVDFLLEPVAARPRFSGRQPAPAGRSTAADPRPRLADTAPLLK